MVRKKNDEAVSPGIGVILMVAITVILAAVIAAFVYGVAGNVGSCNSCEQIFTKNITIASTDYGDLIGPYYLRSTEQESYQIHQKKIYVYAENHICQNVTITYTQSCNNGNIIPEIINIKSNRDNYCSCNSCQPCKCSSCGC